MSGSLETALLKANVYPVKGREVFWLIVKGQLEHVITDSILCSVPFSQSYISGLAVWQGLAVPVISLEKYFNFKMVHKERTRKRLLVKTALQNTERTAARLLIDIPHDIRMRTVGEGCVPAKIPAEVMKARGLVGVYEWDKDKLLLIPDLTRIAMGGLEAAS